MARREDKRCAPRQFVQWDRSRVAVKADAADACTLYRPNKKVTIKARARETVKLFFFDI